MANKGESEPAAGGAVKTNRAVANLTNKNTNTNSNTNTNTNENSNTNKIKIPLVIQILNVLHKLKMQIGRE